MEDHSKCHIIVLEFSARINPVGHTLVYRRVTRGGGWRHEKSYMHSAYRNSEYPTTHRGNDLGFWVCKLLKNQNTRRD